MSTPERKICTGRHPSGGSREGDFGQLSDLESWVFCKCKAFDAWTWAPTGPLENTLIKWSSSSFCLTKRLNSGIVRSN